MNLKMLKTLAALSAGALVLGACSSTKSSGDVKPEKVEVGGLFAMTGAFASYGEQQSNGVKLAFEEVNADGGAGGSELVLKIEDVKGEPAVGVTALNKLASIDKVPFVFTSISNVISATAPVGTQQKVVMMNGGGTAPTLAGLSPYLFSNVPLETLHIENIAKWAVEDQGHKTLGILYSDDALGQADSEVMEKAWKDLGGEVVSSQSVETAATSYRSQLTQIAGKKPDAVYMAVGGQQIPIGLNQARELGMTSQILGTSFWTVSETLEAAKGSSEGVVFSTQEWNPEDPSNEDAAKFVEAYTEKFGSEPQGNAAAYYVGARILADVVTELNEQEKEISSDNIKAALIDMGAFDTIFGEITFAEDGTSTMPVSLLTVKDSAFVPVK
jgi:branched-chain amino acid transport system substrate-binding protein